MGHLNPEIAWHTLGSQACLKFTFNGYLTEADTERAVLEWRQAVASMPHESITLIWDCLKMEGYAHKARSQWTHAMLEMKSQITSIWLITRSPIIKMGATVMGMFSQMNIHIAKSEDEILRVFTPPPMPFLHDGHRDDTARRNQGFWDGPE